MALVSVVGRRSLRVRLLFLGMYLLLTIGAVTMVYPFLIMVTMSTTGMADSQDFQTIPSYWMSDAALFRKYLADAAPVPTLATWFGKDTWFTARDIRDEDLKPVMEMPAVRREAMAHDLREFITKRCPSELRMPLFIQDKDSPLALQSEFYDYLEHRYGSVERANRLYPDNATTWEELGVVNEQTNRLPDSSSRMRDWRNFIQSRLPERTGLFDITPELCQYLLTVQIPKSYHGQRDSSGKTIVSDISWDDVASGKLGTQILKDFVSTKIWTRFVRVDVAKARPAWRDYLASTGKDPRLLLSARIPSDEKLAGIWGKFVQSKCPVEAVGLVRAEDYWRPFLRQKYGDIGSLNAAYGTRYASFDRANIPYAAFHYENFLHAKGELRREYLEHNFAAVISFVTLHGNAALVTVIYILLTIATTLTVNPLAAYAMSRFRLKESYHILVFLLATMAFPGEVLMIPSFLMIKSFPLLQIAVVGVCALVFLLIQMKLKSRMSPVLSGAAALLITLVLAGWVAPHAASTLGLKPSVSLMNSFWALVLPGLANGYGIFLLKGFFDSLPPELYEAGLIDGASELRMFWQITIPLCKPILAVMVLGAFGAAYGAFMHAFLVCQDPKMWTLMVFLYEFQQTHGVPMATASLVIAAGLNDGRCRKVLLISLFRLSAWPVWMPFFFAVGDSFRR